LGLTHGRSAHLYSFSREKLLTAEDGRPLGRPAKYWRLYRDPIGCFRTSYRTQCALSDAWEKPSHRGVKQVFGVSLPRQQSDYRNESASASRAEKLNYFAPCGQRKATWPRLSRTTGAVYLFVENTSRICAAANRPAKALQKGTESSCSGACWGRSRSSAGGAHHAGDRRCAYGWFGNVN